MALLLAVTLKLSEARFRPLFQRLLAWASVAPSDQPGEACHAPCLRRPLHFQLSWGRCSTRAQARSP